MKTEATISQIEKQAAFNPANTVPGISFSPDRMLQGRLFSYGDAQRYRLGVNHNLIPVNAPQGVKHPHSFHRDGAMRTDDNMGSELHYEPNSYGNWEDNPLTTFHRKKVVMCIDTILGKTTMTTTHSLVCYLML